MKKLLFGIFAFLGIGLSFCSSEDLYFSASENVITLPTNPREYTLENSNFPGYICIVSEHDFLVIYSGGFGDLNGDYTMLNNYDTFCTNDQYIYIRNNYLPTTIYFYYYDFPEEACPSSTINVLYNNEQSSSTVNCNGDNLIIIDGLSTITATNKRTPYYNISYKDEDNQSLVESYSKSNLYLENGQFKKTYTGNNDWILTAQGGNCSENSFSGYLPTFDITGGIEEVSESGNIFNNFAENSVKFAFSNIPSYIQYVLMFALLMLILGLVKPFKRRR